LATEAMPISPPAPARFTTTTLRPACFSMVRARRRAVRSVPAPAEKGTTMVIGRSG